jgi:hypothetical protein
MIGRGKFLPIRGWGVRPALESTLRRHGNSLEILSGPKCGGG